MHVLRTISIAAVFVGMAAVPVITAPVANAAPSNVSVSNGWLTEGASGTQLMNFTVVRGAPFDTTVIVDWATSNGTATAGSDYVASNGTATITPGTDRTTFTVAVTGDSAYEPDEYFRVTLSNPSSATIVDGEGIGAIFNDDPAPPNYTLTVSRVGFGSVTSSPPGITCGWDCIQPYITGTAVTLTATPSGGYTVNWTGCDSSAGTTCSLTMTANRQVTATFARV